MLQKTVYKSRALQTGVLILACLIVLSLFPLRLWRKTVSFEGTGTPLVKSKAVTYEPEVSQVFVAQYDRVASFDVYVAEVTGGRYLDVSLRSAKGTQLLHRTIDMQEFEIPGYVRISAGVRLEVGEQYRLFLKGNHATFYLALEPVVRNPVPYMGAFFYEYTPDPALRLQMATHYDVPQGKIVSLAGIAAVIAAALALCALIRAGYKKNPDKDRLLPVAVVTERVLYVVSGAGYLVLFLLNFPLKKFNDRPGEIAWLALGILLAAALTFYAIRRWCTEPHRREKMALRDGIAAGFLALAICYGCEYMNGVFNMMHYASARQMVICILAAALVSFRTELMVSRVSAVWLVLSSLAGLWYVHTNLLPVVDEQDPYKNTVTIGNALIVILAGLLLIGILRCIRGRHWNITGISRYGLLTALTGGMMIAFRHKWWWPVTLVVVFFVYYLCVGKNIGAKRAARILITAVNVQFLLTVGYCLIFRAYQAFIYTRFGMVFHTVAGTGEYLSSVTLFAAAQLLNRLERNREKESLRLRIRSAWREWILFALSGVYAVFTVSRTAYLTIVMGILFLLLLYALREGLFREGGTLKKACARSAGVLLMMMAAVMLMFPAAFSLQRILPAMAGRNRPITYLEETAMVHDVSGSARWDSTYYISGIRFWSLFRARILRLPELPYNYPEDKYNQDKDGNYIYTPEGELIRDEAPVEQEADTSSGAQTEHAEDGEEETAELQEVQPTGENTADISNGRLDIFRDYIALLNLTGHETMNPEGKTHGHAHNSYLQVMYDNGIPTGIVFTVWTLAGLFLSAVYYVKRKAKEDSPDPDEYLTACAGMSAFALVGLTELGFFLCNPVTVMMLCGILPLMEREAS